MSGVTGCQSRRALRWPEAKLEAPYCPRKCAAGVGKQWQRRIYRTVIDEDVGGGRKGISLEAYLYTRTHTHNHIDTRIYERDIQLD